MSRLVACAEDTEPSLEILGEDAALELGSDVFDAAVDTAPDAAVDTAPDAAVDTAPDTAVDAGLDIQTDTVIDTSVDAGADDFGGDTDTSEPSDADTDAASDVVSDLANDVVADDGSNDAGPDTDVDISSDTSVPCGATIAIDAPTMGELTYTGAPIPVAATVTTSPPGTAADYSVLWLDLNGTVLATTPVAAGGAVTADLTGLTQGSTGITARLQNAAGLCDESAQVFFVGCGGLLAESFDTGPDPSFWTFSGDASWDPGGWIELTGLDQNRSGALYSHATKLEEGSASVQYRVRTGGGTPGADGFAITFVDAVDVTELETIVGNAVSGGGLGYGYGGNYGPFTGAALSIEVDTWFNQFNGTTELHTDPTSESHIEVTQGLDPGASLGFTAVTGIQDQTWHDVRVDVIGSTVKVWLDSQLVIDVGVPGLKFPGGYVLLSGSTGFYYNYHSFDDVRVLHACTSANP